MQLLLLPSLKYVHLILMGMQIHYIIDIYPKKYRILFLNHYFAFVSTIILLFITNTAF